MRIAINAISAKRGGNVTYLQNVLSELRDQLDSEDNNRIVVWRGPGATADRAWPEGIEYHQNPRASGGAGAVGGVFQRLYFDQVHLPREMESQEIEVLFSSANYGPLFPRCAQVLFVRNSAYFDPNFLRRMPTAVRAYYALQRQLTLACIRRSDVCLFPTNAMQKLVEQYITLLPERCFVAPFGTRPDLFRSPMDLSPLHNPVRLLNVSLYSDQKNLGTLLEAVRILHRRHPDQFHLSLTAGFNQDWLAASAFFPRFQAERSLYRELASWGIAQDLDWHPYSALPELYRSSDIFVFPSYTESFGHPLVEAMAAGVPIAAASTPTNEEICGNAALYFPAFDIQACAEVIARLAHDSELRSQLIQRGIRRSAAFRWSEHVRALLEAIGAARALFARRRSRKSP